MTGVVLKPKGIITQFKRIKADQSLCLLAKRRDHRGLLF
jgi:hypothetical protein